MWREVGIPKMVNLGNWNKLKDWEKEYFLDGVRDGRWDKKGNHLKDNNPYIKKKKRITERQGEVISEYTDFDIVFVEGY